MTIKNGKIVYNITDGGKQALKDLGFKEGTLKEKIKSQVISEDDDLEFMSSLEFAPIDKFNYMKNKVDDAIQKTEEFCEQKVIPCKNLDHSFQKDGIQYCAECIREERKKSYEFGFEDGKKQLKSQREEILERIDVENLSKEIFRLKEFWLIKTKRHPSQLINHLEELKKEFGEG